MRKSSVAAAESRVVRERGCWWWDSNPQGLAPRDVRGLRVYRFRHTSTSLATNPGNPEGQDARPHTRCRPRATIQADPHESGTKNTRAGPQARATDPGRKPRITIARLRLLLNVLW